MIVLKSKQGVMIINHSIVEKHTRRKFEKLTLSPGETSKPRVYRTQPDAYAQDWPELEKMLADAPELEAKALFDRASRKTAK
jgi:hypothetical protein